MPSARRARPGWPSAWSPTWRWAPMAAAARPGRGRKSLLAEVNVGAPPDILNQSGQDWDVSAFNPEGLRRHGYRAFREMLRANLAWPGGLRIDHVMGLQRLWLIPRGQPPHAGAYLRYPQREPAAAAGGQSRLGAGHRRGPRHRARRPARGTGTPPSAGYPRAALRAARRTLRAPAQWPADAMATTSTHDLPSLSGWWRAGTSTGAAAPDTAAPRNARPTWNCAPRSAGPWPPALNRRSIPTPPPKYRWTPASAMSGQPRAVGATAPGGRPGQPGAAEPARPRRRPPELAAALAGKRRADARNAAGRPAPAPARTQPPGCRGGRP